MYFQEPIPIAILRISCDYDILIVRYVSLSFSYHPKTLARLVRAQIYLTQITRKSAIHIHMYWSLLKIVEPTIIFIYML